MSGLIWIQPVCHSGGNPVGVFRILKGNKQKTKNPEKLRDKHQNLMYWPISSYTVFLQCDKGYLICNLWL